MAQRATLFFTLFLTAFSVSAVRATLCDDEMSSPTSPASMLTKQLTRLGYDTAIAKRLTRRNRDLAFKISRDPRGKPMRLNPVYDERRFGLFKPARDNFVYRGLTVDPWHYDPTLTPVAPLDKKETHHIWVGRLKMAKGYAGIRWQPLGYPRDSEGHKRFTMILELQIPLFAQLTETGAGEAYSKLSLPDESLFIRRIGILDWSSPSPKRELPKIKFYDYDQIYDESGHVRADAPL